MIFNSRNVLITKHVLFVWKKKRKLPSGWRGNLIMVSSLWILRLNEVFVVNYQCNPLLKMKLFISHPTLSGECSSELVLLCAVIMSGNKWILCLFKMIQTKFSPCLQWQIDPMNLVDIELRVARRAESTGFYSVLDAFWTEQMTANCWWCSLVLDWLQTNRTFQYFT